MRTFEYRPTHVPAFLTKLWKLVADPSSDDLISWSITGSSFIIYDEIRFSKELLPMYFKHNNMASFVRQLNMYGFRKLSCIDQGGINNLKNEIEFYHHFFVKNQESMLELIKRKIPSNRSSDDSKVKPEYVKELVTNIKYLQGKQQNSDECIRSLRKENKLLWRQFTVLNNRYAKQQAMLQQVLPLFMNMVQSSHRISSKRQPLMIPEGENNSEIIRNETSYLIEHADSDLSSDFTPSPGNVSNRGLVIHDVTEVESSSIFADNIVCSMTAPKENDVIVDSPLSSLGSAEHTMDSSYAETTPLAAASMASFNVLNCGFASSADLRTSEELLQSNEVTMSPKLGVQNVGLPYPSPDTGAIPAVATYLGSPQIGVNLGMPFQAEESCSAQDMMCIINEASSSPNVASERSEDPPIENIFSWLPTAVSANEQYLDNWLGQVFTADNLQTGASLPVKHQ